MAMLITKFHRLIQNKVIWILFTTAVVISFVFMFTTMPDQDDMAQGSAVGELDGEPISNDVFRNAYYNTYLSLAMAVGRGVNITPELDTQLEDAAWRRIAALRRADSLGIRATDREVVATIQSHPGFSSNGQFNPQAYAAFVRNFLASMRVTEAQFEDHVREEIAMQKLRHMVNQSVLVSPYEMKRMFNTISDSFVIEYVKISADIAADEVEATLDEAEAFYEDNKDAFEIPEQVRVKYVKVPAAPFTSKVEASVTAEQVETYYQENQESYLVEQDEPEENLEEEIIEEEIATEEADDAADEDEVLASGIDEADITFLPSEEDEEMEEDIQPLYRPLDEVEGEIREMMVRERALTEAAELATDFVIELTPDLEGNAPSFEELATKYGWEIEEAEPFTANQLVPEIDADALVNREAFALLDNPEDYFSDVIVGTNAAYVLALVERIPPYIPAFDEVSELAREAAAQKAATDAMADKVLEIKEAAEKAIDEGDSFSDAMAEFDLEVIKTEEFTAATGPEAGPDDEILLRGILARNNGEVSDPLPTEDGVIIAHVISRKPGDPTTFEALKPQIRDSLKRDRHTRVFREWEEYLLRAASFSPRTAGDEEDASDESAAAASDADDRG